MNPPKYRENTITSYYITEENIVGNIVEKKEYYDLLNTIIICLGTPEKENYEGVLKLLQVLLSTEKPPKEKIQILKEDFQIQMTKRLEKEVTEMCNLSAGVEAKGIEKGIEKGIKQERLSSLRKMMKNMHISAEEAMTVLEIPEHEKSTYMELLETI